MSFRTRETRGELALPQVNELLLGRPPSRRVALRLEEAPGARQRFQVFGVTEMEIGLRAGTEADRVTVGVLLRQDVDSGGQRVEPLFVEQVVDRQLAIPIVAGNRRDVKQVFRDDVGLVVWWIALANSVARHGRNVAQTFLNRYRQQVFRLLDAAQLKGVDQPDDVFVHDVGGPLRLRIRPCVRAVGAADELAEARDQPGHFCMRRPIARRRAEPREPGNVLSKCQAGHKAVRVVPAAHVWAGRR